MPPNFYNLRDQAIYSAGDFFIPQERYRAAPYNVNKPAPDDPAAAGIPAIYQSQGGGGGGTYTGGISDLTGNFFQTTSDRQNRLTELNRPLTTFPSFKGARTSDLGGDPYGLPEMKGFSANEMYNRAAAAKAAGQDTMPSFAGITNVDEALRYADDRIQDHRMRYATGQLGPSVIREEPTLNRRINDAFYSLPFLSKPQSADQIIAEGYTGQSNMPGIMSMVLGSMDKYGELPRGDQAFIARNMGYTGPTVFGENTTGGAKDPFGLNVRSGFGNYAEAVENQVNRLDKYFGGENFDKKYGEGTTLEFDEETGTYMFKGTNAAKANQMNKMNLAKYNFYKKQVEQRDADRAAAAAAEAEAKRRRAEEIFNKPGRETGGGGREVATDAGSVAGAQQDISNYQSFGEVPLADGGRVNYMMGGLAGLVDIYD